MSTPTSPPTTPFQRIAIVGGGLAGLALSLFVRRVLPASTSQITILEARPSDALDGGYLALAPNALHVLDQLGIYQQLLKQGCAYEEIRIYSARSLKTIGTVLNGSHAKYGYPALRVPRGVVRGMLMKEVLSKESNVDVRYGVKVEAVEDKSGDKAGVRVKTAAGWEEYDLVIGADGIHSRVRRLLSEKEPTFSGQVGIGGGAMPRDIVPKDLHLPFMMLGKSNGFMAMPTSHDGSTISCFANVEMENKSREGWAEMGDAKDDLKKRLVDGHCGPNSEWPELVQRICRESKPESLTVWPHFHAPVLDTWLTSSNRVILLGDAAHAMPPTGGQGAAQAFEDVASLACVIGNSADGAAFDRHVRQWESTRRKRCSKIKAFTTRGGDLRRGTPSKFQQMVKEWVMWAFMWWKGADGGLSWVYSHREPGPKAKSG